MPLLEGGEDVLHLDLAGAGHVHDAHVRRVLHAPATRPGRRRRRRRSCSRRRLSRSGPLASRRRRRVRSQSSRAPPSDEQLVQHRHELPVLLVLELDRLGRAGGGAASAAHALRGLDLHLALLVRASGAPYGQTFTQVMQAVHLSASTCATWPPISRYGLRQDRRRAARGGLRLGDRLVHEARRVGEAAEEDRPRSPSPPAAA